MNKALAAIKAELAEVRKKKAAATEQLEEKIARYKVREDALEAAAAALTGTPVPGGRGPDRRPRVPGRKRDVEVLDAVRKAGGPVEVKQLATDTLPYASVQRSFGRLLKAGKVKLAGQTKRGGLIVEYVPVTVRPGELVPRYEVPRSGEGSND